MYRHARLSSALILSTVALMGCKEKYDESNALKGDDADYCVRHETKYGFAYSKERYNELCRGRSIEISAFVVSSDGSEFKLSPEDPMKIRSIEQVFYAEAPYGRATRNEKAVVRGVLGSRTFLGYAAIENAEISEQRLTAEENFARYTDLANQRVIKEMQNGTAYAKAKSESNTEINAAMDAVKSEYAKKAVKHDQTNGRGILVDSYVMEDGSIVICKTSVTNAGKAVDCR